ncbi:hypothetical protein L6452_16632 [Arctium lappa]|uniref:Uncharacterized protein n=1 Tax=Arctium lappa TaxID=4217 RepID=A0ACB9C1H4_ARCLA|nr:hypothetical protein L6452_16632 [Arctium lappa]
MAGFIKSGSCRLLQDCEGCKRDGSVVFWLEELLWHGGSVYGAWLNCASNQVAQVLFAILFLSIGDDFRNHITCVVWFAWEQAVFRV